MEVLITGATGGIGRALCFEFASKGCNLMITATNTSKLKELEGEILSQFNSISVVSFTADLSSTQDISDLCNYFENVDILINNAGIFPIKNLLTSTLEEFDECMSINLRAPFILCKHYGSLMKKKSWGRIVNIGSSSAYYGNGSCGVYCTSKHALLGLTRSLYQELRKDGVRVYSVSPGSAQTPMGKTDIKQNYETFIKPHEIAEYVSFIVSYDKEMISEEIRLNRILVK